MAKQLQKIENYVVFSDTTTGDNLGEYAINHCVYTEETDRFIIKEVIDNGSLTILKSEITAGDWVDGGAVAYDERGMRDFLLANTGFKAAGGGSPATIGDLLVKTGQTVSFRTGDDGGLQAGRLLSFDRLKSNNPFGNDLRFTDTVGTQVYANNIVIDWSTYDEKEVLGYYTLLIVGTPTNNWEGIIDTCLTLSVGTFTSGWRLMNVKEAINIANYGSTNVYDYAPFNLSTGYNTFSSTTQTNATGNALYMAPVGGRIFSTGKTNTSSRGLAVRNFTVTGTSLT